MRKSLGHFVWVMPGALSGDQSGKAANVVTRVESGIETARLLASELCDVHGRPTAVLEAVEVYEPVAAVKTASRVPRAARKAHVRLRPNSRATTWHIPPEPSETVYALQQAAEKFGIKPVTIYAWVASSKLRTVSPAEIAVLPPGKKPKYGIRHADLAAVVQSRPEWRGADDELVAEAGVAVGAETTGIGGGP